MSHIRQEDINLFKTVTAGDEQAAKQYLERYHDTNAAILNYFAQENPNKKQTAKSPAISDNTTTTQSSEGKLSLLKEKEVDLRQKIVLKTPLKGEVDDWTQHFMDTTGFDKKDTENFLIFLFDAAITSPRVGNMMLYNNQNMYGGAQLNYNGAQRMYPRYRNGRAFEPRKREKQTFNRKLFLKKRKNYDGYMKKYRKGVGAIQDKAQEWPKYLGSAIVECYVTNGNLLLKINTGDQLHFEPQEIDYGCTNTYKKMKDGKQVFAGQRWSIKNKTLFVQCFWEDELLGTLSCEFEEAFVFLLNNKYVILEGLVVDDMDLFHGKYTHNKVPIKVQLDVFLTKEVIVNPLNIAPAGKKSKETAAADGDDEEEFDLIQSESDQKRRLSVRYSKESLAKLFKILKLKVTIPTMVKLKQKGSIFNTIEKEKGYKCYLGPMAEVITDDFPAYYNPPKDEKKGTCKSWRPEAEEPESDDGELGPENGDDEDKVDFNFHETRPLNWITGRGSRANHQVPTKADETENNKQNQDLLNTNHISSYYITTEAPETLKTGLHVYQKQALSWMLHREGCLDKNELFAQKPPEERVLNDLFQEMELLNGSKLYFNPFTGEVTTKLPVVKSCQGGILADEMGLGKTVMAISLLHKHRRPKKDEELVDHFDRLEVEDDEDENENEIEGKMEEEKVKEEKKSLGKKVVLKDLDEEIQSDNSVELEVKKKLKKEKKKRTTIWESKGEIEKEFEDSEEEEINFYKSNKKGKRQVNQKLSSSKKVAKQEPKLVKKVKEEINNKSGLKRKDSFDDLIDDLTSGKGTKMSVEKPKLMMKTKEEANTKFELKRKDSFDDLIGDLTSRKSTKIVFEQRSASKKALNKVNTIFANAPNIVDTSMDLKPVPTIYKSPKKTEETQPKPAVLKEEKEKREKKVKQIVKGLGKPAGTLIVVPVTVLAQWESEIKKHSHPDTLSVFQFYGNNRSKDLSAYDVVLTTYGLIESEYKKQQEEKTPSKLFECDWFRIILDEAHYIRTRQAKTTKAMCALKAEYRWCLTGTPLQNKLDDMFSLFQFLKMDTWGEYFWWNTYINKHTSNEEASHLIRGIMKPVILRRTKNSTYLDGRSILALPQKQINAQLVKLSEEEKQIYQCFFRRSKKKFNDIVNQGTLQYEYAHIFELILRLRQVCDHPSMVFSKDDLKDADSLEDAVKKFLDKKNENSENISVLAKGKKDKNKTKDKGTTNSSEKETEFIQKTIDSLKKKEIEPCSICLEEVTEPTLAKCAHIFCKECLELSLKKTNRCPLCQKEISINELMSIKLADQENSMALLDINGANFKKSSKLAAVMGEVHKVAAKGEKVVVFSQFVTMLNLIERFMKDEGVEYRRIDGSCTLKQRQKSIEEFSTDKRVTVFLISLKAGAIGLNLTVATNVFLVDPWWNPAMEDQAIERVHRIGQEKDVKVIRFICEKTIEERIQELKERKKEMIKQVLQFNPEEQKKTNIENMIYIMKGFDEDEDEDDDE